MTENEPLRQLRAAGYERYVRNLTLTDRTITATADLELIAKLVADQNFQQGLFYILHRDIGINLTEFRSYRGQFGKGSLQIVVDKATGSFYCDVDRFSGYEDLFNIVGHVFGEVIPNWWRKLTRKKEL